jgi:hypothetical protein
MGSVAVIDGANVAYIEKNKEGAPKVSNLTEVRSALTKMGYEVFIIIDASLRYQVDDPEKLESLLDEQIVHQAPAGTDADYFILEMAKERDALIVSNDEYEQYRKKYPWIEERRLPLMIINGHVELYKPNLEKNSDEQEENV